MYWVGLGVLCSCRRGTRRLRLLRGLESCRGVVVWDVDLLRVVVCRWYVGVNGVCGGGQGWG